MSPIDFDSLQADHPELEAVWPLLRYWFVNHGAKHFVELPVLIRALPGLDRFDLVTALHAMIDEDMLESAYKVRAPDGHLLKGEFRFPSQVPEKLPTRDGNRRIRTKDADVVPGYKWDAVGVA